MIYRLLKKGEIGALMLMISLAVITVGGLLGAQQVSKMVNNSNSRAAFDVPTIPPENRPSPMPLPSVTMYPNTPANNPFNHTSTLYNTWTGTCETQVNANVDPYFWLVLSSGTNQSIISVGHLPFKGNRFSVRWNPSDKRNPQITDGKIQFMVYNPAPKILMEVDRPAWLGTDVTNVRWVAGIPRTGSTYSPSNGFLLFDDTTSPACIEATPTPVPSNTPALTPPGQVRQIDLFDVTSNPNVNLRKISPQCYAAWNSRVECTDLKMNVQTENACQGTQIGTLSQKGKTTWKNTTQDVKKVKCEYHLAPNTCQNYCSPEIAGTQGAVCNGSKIVAITNNPYITETTDVGPGCSVSCEEVTASDPLLPENKKLSVKVENCPNAVVPSTPPVCQGAAPVLKQIDVYLGNPPAANEAANPNAAVPHCWSVWNENCSANQINYTTGQTSFMEKKYCTGSTQGIVKYTNNDEVANPSKDTQTITCVYHKCTASTYNGTQPYSCNVTQVVPPQFPYSGAACISDNPWMSYQVPVPFGKTAICDENGIRMQ